MCHLIKVHDWDKGEAKVARGETWSEKAKQVGKGLYLQVLHKDGVASKHKSSCCQETSQSSISNAQYKG